MSLSSLVAMRQSMMSWCEAKPIASTAGFADVALSDVADERVMKKRPQNRLKFRYEAA